MNASAPESDKKRDLSRYIQTFDNVLQPDFCKRMIDSFERLDRLQTRSGRNMLSNLSDSSWTELNVSKAADPSLDTYFHQQAAYYLDQYNKKIGLTLPIPFRKRFENLRIKRYSVESGDRFQPHFDALDYSTNRYMVFLWYLNDVAEGGETKFCDLNVKIAAREGRLLMFPPYWMFQHAGLPPRSNAKYIISTYLLF